MFFRVDIDKIIRLEENQLDRTSDTRFTSVWSLNFFTSTPFKVTFLETLNDHRFFLEHLLGAIIFLNFLFFLDLQGRPNLFDQFDFHFFNTILPYIWSKTGKRKTISPMAVRGVFHVNIKNIIRLENKSARSDIGCIFYVRLKIKFSQIPL